MTSLQQATVLINKADGDIHVLTILRGDISTPDEIWGFHAQQAVEKLLKCLLVFRSIAFPFTHHLLELADRLQDAGYALDVRFEPLLDLTPYAVELRYSTPGPKTAEPPLDRQAVLRLITELRQAACTVLDRK